MNFQTMYNEKLTSAEDAVKVVNSGDWVDYGWCTGTPVALDAAMAKRLPELTDVNFRGGILMHVPEIFKIDSPAPVSYTHLFQDLPNEPVSVFHQIQV